MNSLYSQKSIYLLLCLFLCCFQTKAQGIQIEAQDVPVFSAQSVIHYAKDSPSQKVSGRSSIQGIDDLEKTFKEFSLVKFNGQELSAFVQNKEQISFKLNIEGFLETPITIYPNQILADDATSIVFGSNGKVIVPSDKKVVTYKGNANISGGGAVRFMIDGERIQGFVTVDGKKIFLENLNTMIKDAEADMFVAYHAADVIEEGVLDCIAQKTEDHDDENSSQRIAATCSGDWELEVATAATYGRYDDFNSVSGVNNEILGILNNVQSNYDQFDIKIKVVEQVVITCSGCEPWGNSSSPSTLLNLFTNWGPSGFTKTHDEGILFFDGAGGGTVGVAWLSTICKSSRYAVVDRLNSAEKNRVLVAHEMGHNFSAGHDASGAPYIMAPSVNSSNSWSSNSINSINNHISSRTCLACIDGTTPDPDPDPTPTCSAPTNLTVSGLESTSVNLSWNAALGAQFYTLRVRLDGSSTWSSFDLSSIGASLSSLNPGTTYQWQVRTSCADANSNYVNGSNFTTNLSDDPDTGLLRDPENPPNVVNGLEYSYYEGTWNQLPNFNSLTPVKEGVIGNFDLSVRNINSNFGLVFSGYIEVPSNGEYTFYTNSDDGSQLRIGSTLVVDNDGLHGAIEKSGKIGLKQGRHAITVTFFEKTGAESLSVSYASAGMTKSLVPATALYRNNGSDPVPGAGLPWVEAFDLTNGTTSDSGTTGWTIDIVENFGGYAEVKEGKLAFSAIHAVWTSSKIDIADVSYFSMVYQYQGASQSTMEDSDYLTMEYRYDNGPWELRTEENGGTSGINEPYSSRGGSEVANAQTLQIRITANASDIDEIYYVDNLNIQCLNCAASASAILSVEEYGSNNVVVYPSPFSDTFRLQLKEQSESVDIRVLDLQGKVVYRETNIDASQPIDMTNVNSGLYILEVQGSNFKDNIKILKK